MSRSDDGTADAHTTTDETPVDLSRPDERIAHERARYLETTTGLRAKEADAVAWSELGYSSSGIAKQIDSGASTVSTYLERAIAAYGPEATYARASADLATDADLTPVTEGDVLEWPAHYREVWRDAVERHPDRAADVATREVGR